MRLIRLCVLLAAAATAAFSQTPDTALFELPPVITTAMRSPLPGSRVPQTCYVVNAQAMDEAGVQSVEEALQRFAGVDVQPRGIFGVQSDVSVRGSLYSQSLILVDGVPVNDPQTAHHNFDLPVALDQVGSIEVLNGPGSAQYGPDANGGIINVITRRRADQTASLRLSGGEHGLLNGSGSFGIGTGMVHSLVTLERRHADGDRFDTDFTTLNASSSTTIDLAPADLAIVGGYTDKAFGAFDFYSPGAGVPSREWTKTFFASAASHVPIGRSILAPAFFYRSHRDRFMFDTRTPDLYVNNHTAQSYGVDLNTKTGFDDGVLLVTGIAANADRLRSTNLGDHQRQFAGIHADINGAAAGGFLYDAGVREDYQTGYNPQWDPTGSVGFLIDSTDKVYGTVGRSFRVPSYTELYYSDPANEGNPDLKPEVGWSYEIGGEAAIGPKVSLSTAVFVNTQSDLIDYVQTFPGDKFHAVNYTSASTRGIDLSVRWKNLAEGWLGGLSGTYTFLDSRVDRGNVFASKYAFTHPKHQILLDISGIVPGARFGYFASAVYKRKPGAAGYTLLDAKVSKELAPVTLSLQGTNLLNLGYQEIPGVPLPGRWIWGEIRLQFRE